MTGHTGAEHWFQAPFTASSRRTVSAKTSAGSGPFFAAKQLALVEVDPKASHQHEFNAGGLRRLLGFGLDKVDGPLTILAQTADGADPAIDESTYTLYDARENIPGRTEWRLYYASDLIARAGRPGDLLLMYRADVEDHQIWAVIARQGTQFEHDLRVALALGDTAAIRRFRPTRCNCAALLKTFCATPSMRLARRA